MALNCGSKNESHVTNFNQTRHMKFYIIIAMSFLLGNCKTGSIIPSIPSSSDSITKTYIWEVESTTMKIEDDDPFQLKSNAINALLTEQMKGSRYYISEDSLIFKDINYKVLGKGKIIKKGTDYYTLQDEQGQTGDVKYKISPDEKHCAFTYPNGSTIITRRIQ